MSATAIHPPRRTIGWPSLLLGALLVVAEARAVSAAELVMFEQDYCSWCERWHEEIGVVYAKTTEGRRAPLRKVDIHEALPGDLAHLKVGRFTPTFVLLDDAGREVGRLRGYPGEDFFWGLLGQMLEKLPPDGQNGAAGGAAHHARASGE